MLKHSFSCPKPSEIFYVSILTVDSFSIQIYGKIFSKLSFTDLLLILAIDFFINLQVEYGPDMTLDHETSLPALLRQLTTLQVGIHVRYFHICNSK